MAVCLSVIALLSWAVVTLIIFASISAKRRRTKMLSRSAWILMLSCVGFLLFFYFPHNNLFPARDYAPIDIMSANNVLGDTRLLSEDDKKQILQSCNEMYVSRSAWKTLFHRHIGGGEAVYIYFSGAGANMAENCIACTPYRYAEMKKNGQFYYVWNSKNILGLIQNLSGEKQGAGT